MSSSDLSPLNEPLVASQRAGSGGAAPEDALPALRWRPQIAIARLARLIRSPLYVNSYYLLGSTAIAGIAGFIFWTMVARMTDPAILGGATAAIASAGLLVALCDLGLGAAIIYFSSRAPGEAIGRMNTAIALAWALSGAASIVYALLNYMAAPGLSLVWADPALALCFVLFTIANQIMLLQDAAMLSLRRANLVFWRNVACSVSSLPLLLAFLPLLGPYRAPLAAYMLPNVIVAAIISRWVLPKAFTGYRFFGRFNRLAVSEMASYSFGMHLSNLLWSCTTYALPIIAANALSASRAGVFFISWTLLQFMLIIPRSIIAALFVETAQAAVAQKSAARGLLQRLLHTHRTIAIALLLIALLTTPVAIGAWFLGQWALELFGKAYVDIRLFRLLLASVPPFTISGIVFAQLRARRRLVQAILFSGLIAISILGAALLLAPAMGLEGLAWAWLFGYSLAAALGVAVLLYRSLAARRLWRYV